MGSINFKLDINSEVKEDGFIYKDFNINMNVPENLKDFAQAEDMDAIRQGIKNMFNWKLGQRILEPEFGNSLYNYLYEPINELTLNAIKADIMNMFSRWEPRVNIVKVDIDSNPDQHEIYVAVQYTVPTISDEIVGFNTILNEETL